jgi:hypothetical protein
MRNPTNETLHSERLFASAAMLLLFLWIASGPLSGSEAKETAYFFAAIVGILPVVFLISVCRKGTRSQRFTGYTLLVLAIPAALFGFCTMFLIWRLN